MSTLLVVSPHLDDAVLSCGAAIHAHVRGGDRVVVATVFSEGRAHDRRREEDARALQVLGAGVIHLGLFDAPERLGIERSHRSLVEEARVHESDVVLARDALRTAIGRVQPAQIWAPLGVGEHVDHRVVHAALHDRADVVLYEERPYAFLPGAVYTRLAVLGLHAGATAGSVMNAATRALQHAPDRAVVREALATLPHLRAYLGDDEAGHRSRTWLAARLTEVRPRSGREIVARVTSYDAETAAAVCQAAGMYGSQLDDLFGGPARVAPALRRAALALATGAAPVLHAERTFWPASG